MNNHNTLIPLSFSFTNTPTHNSSTLLASSALQGLKRGFGYDIWHSQRRKSLCSEKLNNILFELSQARDCAQLALIQLTEPVSCLRTFTTQQPCARNLPIAKNYLCKLHIPIQPNPPTTTIITTFLSQSTTQVLVFVSRKNKTTHIYSHTQDIT